VEIGGGAVRYRAELALNFYFFNPCDTNLALLSRPTFVELLNYTGPIPPLSSVTGDLADVTIQSRNKILSLGPGNCENNGTDEFLACTPLDRLAQWLVGTTKAKFKTLIAGEFARKDIHKGGEISKLQRFFGV